MRDLYTRLPVYANSEEVKAIQDGIQAGLDPCFSSVLESHAQPFVMTATWGLPLWEKLLDLTPDTTDEDTRKMAIIAKLRGATTSTLAAVKSVAESYVGGEVLVEELYGGDYVIRISFISTIGEPDGLDALRKRLAEIIPAHLAIEYVFIYNTHNDLHVYTHDHLNSYTHTQLREEDISGE